MVPSIQKEKADLFLQCHHGEEILVLLNSWDVGSSRLIEARGFKAIATTKQMHARLRQQRLLPFFGTNLKMFFETNKRYPLYIFQIGQKKRLK